MSNTEYVEKTYIDSEEKIKLVGSSASISAMLDLLDNRLSGTSRRADIREVITAISVELAYAATFTAEPINPVQTLDEDDD